MKKIIINENQKGFLFRNGRFVKLLSAGKYRIWGDAEAELVSLDQPIGSGKCALDTLLRDKESRRLPQWWRWEIRSWHFIL